ncbi:MAG: TetR/AcrR family transcriptional regulator [Nevskiales bacterium]
MAKSTAQMLEKPRKRRSQAERRDAMRKRLLKATLECLVRDGYAGTTVSSIVKRAGVSRGAHVHHYPTKDALILDAAEYLIRRAYRIMGEVLLGIADEGDRLQALMKTVWEEIFATRMFSAFFELLIASQHDAELARSLRAISARVLQTVDKAIVHYFEPRAASSENTRDMFVMTIIMLSGMAAGSQITQSAEDTRRCLDIWTRLMASQVRARKGVSVPPQRPADWDRLS